MRSTSLAYGVASRAEKAIDPLERALRVFLGWDVSAPLEIADHLPVASQGIPDIVVSRGQTPSEMKRLASAGLIHQHRFAVLPSRNNPRWLLPLMDGCRTLNGFELYQPCSTRAQMMKALVLSLRLTGWKGWVRHEILIGSRRPLPLELLSTEITGESQFVFTLSLGTPGPFQKLTVQVMRPDGVVLGYVKMPLTDAAEERLGNEAEFLHRLSRFPNLRSRIPHLLFGGPWNERNIVFESPVEGRMGPTIFAEIHEEFLASLHRCEITLLPGRRLIQQTAQRWERAASRAGHRLQSMGREALRIAEQELDGSAVPCGIHHGDFAPWNVRAYQGDLFVFDWESAIWCAPNLWDRFHFLTQTENLLQVKHETQRDNEVREQHRGLYLLYLLSSSGQLMNEATEQAAIDFREKQMLRYVSMAAAGAKNDEFSTVTADCA